MFLKVNIYLTLRYKRRHLDIVCSLEMLATNSADTFTVGPDHPLKGSLKRGVFG